MPAREALFAMGRIRITWVPRARFAPRHRLALGTDKLNGFEEVHAHPGSAAGEDDVTPAEADDLGQPEFRPLRQGKDQAVPRKGSGGSPQQRDLLEGRQGRGAEARQGRPPPQGGS